MTNNLGIGKTKVGLVASLYEISNLNVEIERTKSPKIKSSLKTERDRQIKSTKSLMGYLKGVGKMSDKEFMSLVSLDLTSVKDLKNMRIKSDGKGGLY